MKILCATTLHRAAKLRSQNPKINYPDWVNAILLIIDEISFMSKTTLENLDKYLRIMTGRKQYLFGGVHIIVAEDFYQIPPVAEGSEALYKEYCIQWEALNAAIILKNNHRFR